MQFRIATAATVFALFAAPLAADISKPVAGQVPAADISDDQALGCMYRLIVLNNLTTTSLKNTDRSAADRETASSLSEKTNRGVTFYAALIYSRPWIADRQKQLINQVVAMDKQKGEVSSSFTLDCLERSLQAQNQVLDVVIGK